MRNMLGAVTILAATLVAVSGGSLKWQESALSQPAFIIEVSCPDAEGCFSLIGKAIQQAPAGATIRIAPGTYYERPLTIEKSLRLEGLQTEIEGNPRIVLVDVGTAILIQASSLLTVELQRLSIEALIQDPFSFEGSIGIGVFTQTPEKVQVVLKGVNIRSYQGMSIAGDQQGELSVEIVNADILAALVGIEVNMGKLILRGSALRSPAVPSLRIPWIGIFIQPSPSLHIEALLTGTRIEGFNIGLWAIASSHLGQGRIALQAAENVIISNRQDGLYLLGDRVDAELSRNEIRENGKYGIRLALPDCTSVPRELRFQGIVQGTENEFFNNKSGNLCPPDFPWPPDFVKR
jgi:hypothetical protein